MLREFRREFNKTRGGVCCKSSFQFHSRPIDGKRLRCGKDLTQLARAKKEKEVQPAQVRLLPFDDDDRRRGKTANSRRYRIASRRTYGLDCQQSWIESASGFWHLAACWWRFIFYVVCFSTSSSTVIDHRYVETRQATRLSTLCMVLANLMAHDPWRAELIPIVVCAATATIAYDRNVTLVLLTALALATTIALGLDLAEFVILMSAGASTTLLLGRIRSRTRLIYVTSIAATVTALTTIGVGSWWVSFMDCYSQ